MKLYLNIYTSAFIASEFDWNARSNVDIETSLPATIDIDMTLTKRPIDCRRPPKMMFLEDTAFQPKTYRLQLEEGSFHVIGRTQYGANPTYKYRLVWDKSPYPPLDEWKERKALVNSWKFSERKDFYQGELKPY